MEKAKVVKKEDAVLTSSKFDITTSIEGGGEYAMPDYYPEIRRIVSVGASALPDTKFLSGETLEYGGTLAFNVLYIGENGALVSLPWACEYSAGQALPAGVRGVGETAIEVHAESPQCRVLAPRRVSLRARMKVRISADEKEHCACRVCVSNESGETVDAGPADMRTVQRLDMTVPVLVRGRGAVTGSVSGAIHERAGAKPLSCQGAVNVTEVSCRRDAVHVRGEIILRCLCFGAGGSYAPVRGRLPFEETIACEGAAEGDRARAWGRAASVSVSEAEDGSGELRAEAEYDLECEWSRTADVSVTRDAYSTEWELKCEYGDVGVLSPLCCCTSPLTVSGSGKRSTKPVDGEYLIDAVCEPQAERVQLADGKVIFTGSCAVRAIIASEGEAAGEDFSLPFRFECPCDTDGDAAETVWSADVTATDISGRLEGDRIVCSIELCLSVSAQRKTHMAPVGRLIIDKGCRRAHNAAAIKVCYPSPEESIWSIAKRCGAAARDVERLNGVNRADISDGRPLIIPQLQTERSV